MPTAPCLWITAPTDTDAAPLVRLLACVCRHSLVISEVTRTSYRQFARDLQPTLMILQPTLPASVQRLLWTSITQGLPVATTGCLVDLFGARVICTQHAPDDFLVGSAIRIAVTPQTCPASVLNEQMLEATAEEFQSKLLGYRLDNFANVRRSTFDVPPFTSPTRALARSLGACIVDDAELQAGVARLLADHDEEVRAERSAGPEAVVLEAALFQCHDGQKPSAYVHEFRKVRDEILSARGEVPESGDRGVGAIMKDLGLRTVKLNGKGRGLRLTPPIRRKIHRLAQEYDVALVEEKVKDCADCAAVRNRAGEEE